MQIRDYIKSSAKAVLFALCFAATGIALASRDGSGTYYLPAGNPVVTGTAISSTWANSTLSDVATALTNSLSKDGQTVPTADLPMGTYRHTNVGNASARNQYAAVGQVQDGAFLKLTSVSGTNTVTAALSPVITSYSAGMIVTLTPANSNTGATTLAVNGLTALDVQKYDGDALASGDLVAGIPALLVLDSGADDWLLINPQSDDASASVILSRLLTVDGASSALDADLLDGQHGSYYQSASNLNAGTLADARVAQSNVTQHQAALALAASQITSGTLAVARGGTGTTTSTGSGNVVLSASPTLTGTVTAATVAATTITQGGSGVWTAANDGSGSGLDADTVDGQHASAFAASSHTHTSSQITDLPTLASGTYTPTIGGSGGTGTGQYIRVGNVCTVSGTITSSASGSVAFTISLPVSSNLTATGDLGGVLAVNDATSANEARAVYAETTSDVATMPALTGVTSASHLYSFHFTYRVQ